MCIMSQWKFRGGLGVVHARREKYGSNVYAVVEHAHREHLSARAGDNRVGVYRATIGGRHRTQRSNIKMGRRPGRKAQGSGRGRFMFLPLSSILVSLMIFRVPVLSYSCVV